MREMEACWPSGVALRGEASNHPVLALAEDRRGERQGEGVLDASGGDQEDVPESARSGDRLWACAFEASLA